MFVRTLPLYQPDAGKLPGVASRPVGSLISGARRSGLVTAALVSLTLAVAAERLLGPFGIAAMLALLGLCRLLYAWFASLACPPLFPQVETWLRSRVVAAGVLCSVASVGLLPSLLGTPVLPSLVTVLGFAVLSTGALVIAGGRNYLFSPPTMVAATGRQLRQRIPPPIAAPQLTPRRTLRDRFGRLRPALPVVVITLVGLALRLVVTRSIWVDEAISIRQAQEPYSRMFTQLRDADAHPPLYHSVLWLVVHLTGSTSEVIVRLPSQVAGIAMIPLFFVIGRDLWDRRTGLLAALLVAVAPIAIWYSQEARMYAFWMLGASLAIWAQCRILRRPPGEFKDWALFTLASAALLYTQHFTVLPLMVAILLFAGTAWTRRRTPAGRALARRCAWSVLATMLALLPLVPFLVDQWTFQIKSNPPPSVAPGQAALAVSSSTADAPDVYAIIANAVWALWGYHSNPTMVLLSALWPFLILLCFALLGRGLSREVLLLIAVAVLPMLFLFAVGFKVRSLFELRYFIASVPALLLACARMVSFWGVTRFARIVFPAVLVASMLAGLVNQQVNRSNPRIYDFRGAVEWVNARGGSNDLLVYAPIFLNEELHYYPPRMRVQTVADTTVLTPSPQQRVFVLGSFLRDPSISGSVGGVLAELESNGRLVEHRTFPNVEVWEFS